MLTLLATFLILIVETALATFVGLRAWDNRPAKLFVLLTVCMAILDIAAFLRVEATDAPTAYIILAILALALATFEIALLLLLSALFMPAWWEGSRPIRAVIAPYVAVSVALAIDLIGGFGLFANGVKLVDGVYDLNIVRPGGMVLRILFASSWLVHLALLAVAFVRTRASRPLIGWLFLSIGIGMLFSRLLDGFEQIHGLIQSIPILSALAYAVAYTHLFVPTKVAIDLALRAMSEAVAVLDRKGQVVYANSRAFTLGFQLGQPASQALVASGASAVDVAELVESPELPNAGVSRTLMLGVQRIEMQGVSFADAQGRVRGTLLMGRDITEIEERNAQLDQERTRLGTAVRQLEAEQHERAQLVATVRALSLPVIPVLEGVLVLPLVGEFDPVRAGEFTATLLQGIERERARLVLIDITGVPLLDTVSAQGLLSGVRAAALLGARCVLVGVRPEIAQALVALGTSLDGLATAANLQQALWSELGSRRNGLSALA